MKRSTDRTERVMRAVFGCALRGGGISPEQPCQQPTELRDRHVRPAYLSNVSRGSAVV